MINNPSLPIYSIYCITNLINGKKYVGFTSLNPPEKRFKGHLQNSSSGKTILYNSIRKHGKENFEFNVILQGHDRDHVLEMESYFINEYNTFGKNGYNLTTGGEGTSGGTPWNKGKIGFIKHTEEARKKISDSHKGLIPWNKGKTTSDETKQKISMSNIGRKLTDETKHKMKLWQRTNPPWKGKKLSKNHCEKISESNKGKIHTQESKNKMSKNRASKDIFIIEFPNKEVREIIGISKFCRENNLNLGNLLATINSKRMHTKNFKIIERIKIN